MLLYCWTLSQRRKSYYWRKITRPIDNTGNVNETGDKMILRKECLGKAESGIEGCKQSM